MFINQISQLQFSIIQQNMPASKSLRVNLKKPFKIIEQKSQQEKKQPTKDKIFCKIPIPAKHHWDDSKKRNNFFPEIKIVQPLVPPKKIIYLTASYIRYSQNFEVILGDQYQLSQEDYQFFKHHQHLVIKQGSYIFNQDSMKHALIFLEKQAKLKVQPKVNKNWLLPFLKKVQKNKIEQNNIEKFQSLLFNYWRQRHLACGFPLFRPLWKNLNRSDLLYVYRPRSKEKIVKITEQNQQKMAEQLSHQVEGTSTLCQKILANQLLKLKKINNQIKKFYQQAKGFITLQQFNKLLGISSVEIKSEKGRKRTLQTNQQFSKEFSTSKLLQTEKSTHDNFLDFNTAEIQTKTLAFNKTLSELPFQKSNMQISKSDCSRERKQKCDKLSASLNDVKSDPNYTKQSQNYLMTGSLE